MGYRSAGFRGVFAKLFGAFLLVALMPLLIHSYRDVQTTEATVTANAYSALQSAASETLVKLSTVFSNELDVLRMEANDPTIRDAALHSNSLSVTVKADLQAQLGNFLSRNALHIRGYSLYDTQGAPILSTSSRPPGIGIATEDYFQIPLLTGRPFMSGLHEQSDLGVVFYLAAPVLGEQGQPIAVLRATYHASLLQQLLVAANQMAGSGSFAMLIDNHNQLLASGQVPTTLSRERLFRTLDSRSQADGFAPQFIGYLQASSNADKPYLGALFLGQSGRFAVARERLSDQDWQLLFLQPEDVFLRPVIAQTQAILLYIGVVILFTLLAAAVAARILVRPLQRLTGTVLALAEGDLNQRAQLSSRDELGSLGEAFNYMAERLQTRTQELEDNRHELEQLNSELEARVRQRTAELDQANQALLDSRIMLQHILDTIPVRVFWKGVDLRYLGCNLLFAEDAGLEQPEQIIGRSDFDMPWRAMAEKFRQEDRQVLQSQQPFFDIEDASVSLAGGQRWVLAHKIPLTNASGELVGVLGTFEDITERKNAEAAMQQATAKAEQANRAKSVFLANMSHEIRTPMNGILGMVELCFKTDPNPRQQDYLNKIRLSARTLLNILNDILDYSKIEAGHLQIEHTGFDFDELLSQIGSLMAPQAEAKNLEFLFDVDPHMPLKCIGDPLRLSQILLNLCSNAIKFSEQGCIRLVAQWQRLPGNKNGLILKVEDQGIGMSGEQLQQLFDPFVQADSSVSRRFGGTGLGLAISKRLVELMGGDIRVESELGSGSSFQVRVPVEAVKAALIAPLPKIDWNGREVLLVDVKAATAAVIQRQIESWGGRCQQQSGPLADNPKALQKSATAAPLIIADWHNLDTWWPGDAARQLAQHPLILLTRSDVEANWPATAHPPILLAQTFTPRDLRLAIIAALSNPAE